MKEKTMQVKLTANAAARLGIAPLMVGMLLAGPCANAQTKEADMKSVEDKPTAVAEAHVPRITSIKPGGIAIGEEFIPMGEEAQIDQIVALHRDVQEKADRKHTPIPRGQHPKQHGLVRAQFIVEPNLPAHLRLGVFSKPQTFQALIRFSNGRSQNDNNRDAHGMAIKLLGVKGEKVLETEQDAQTQDFIMIDNPIFFVKNVHDYIPLMKSFHRVATGNFLTKSLTGLKMLLSPNYKYRLLRAMGSKRPESPLQVRYWSTTPSRLGPGAMKFSARPDLAGIAPPPKSKSKDKLRLAMSAHLKQHEALFDFLVQLQTDPITMPVEDPTVPWDEAAAPFIKVATIRIPIQSFESKEQMEFSENLSFTPWHAVADLRPLGGINRARKEVYEAISARRHELNGVLMEEPSLSEMRSEKVDTCQARLEDDAKSFWDSRRTKKAISGTGKKSGNQTSVRD
ncbi:MAG: catalase family protein [Verrucomicrobiota bacterium]